MKLRFQANFIYKNNNNFGHSLIFLYLSKTNRTSVLTHDAFYRRDLVNDGSTTRRKEFKLKKIG